MQEFYVKKLHNYAKNKTKFKMCSHNNYVLRNTGLDPSFPPIYLSVTFCPAPSTLLLTKYIM